MSTRFTRKSITLLSTLALLGMTSQAMASTLSQNCSWTINRSGTSTKYRVVAYGDSIYAGYYGSLFNAAKYQATTVDSEYLSTLWNADIQNDRRVKSGAVASDVYNNRIVADKSYMQASNTRVVTFEMCGNDGLQARSALKSQSGTCNFAVLDTALNNCTTYQNAAMSFINANAHPNVKLKVVANLFYPGYNADNSLSNCTVGGAKVNLRNTFLPYLAKMNWRACNFANTYGFECVDNFAEYMGADYDSNGDGQIDSEALKYVQGESEAAYVTRITVTLKSTIRDANTHFVSASTSYDYIQSDDTHPTFTGGTIRAGLFGGTNGSGSPGFTSFPGGKNPIWNRYGHERMGWSLSTWNPPTP